MFRSTISLMRALALVLALLVGPAQAQMTLTGAGGTKAVGYVGPGDITSFLFWYGLRAYSAAYATSLGAAIDVVDSTGANTTTIHVQANGDLNLTELNNFITAHGTPSVTKIYDQSGNLNHATQATVANMPTVATSVLGTKPALSFDSTKTQLLVTASVAINSQPFSMSAIAKRPSYDGGGHYLFGMGATVGLGWDSSAASTLAFFAGTNVTLAGVSDTSFHAIQAVAAGVSSNLYVDGVSNVVSAGTNFPGTGAIDFGQFFSQYMSGYVGEAGVATSGFTVTAGGVASQLNSNQRAYWGF